MTAPRKVRAVAVFELLSTIKTKSWLIVTFGMPVFLLLYGLIIAIPGVVAASRERRAALHGVVDEAGVLGAPAADLEAPAPELPPALRAGAHGELLERSVSRMARTTFRPFPTAAAAREALRRGEIASYFRLPPDYLERGVVERTTLDKPGSGQREARRALAGVLTERLIHGLVPPEVAARVRSPIVSSEDFVVAANGEVRPSGGLARIVRLLVPLLFAILLLLSVLMTAGGLVQATGTEKENKVVEVLLSSANADEILLGKLLGAGAAGLLQMSIWFSFLGLGGTAAASQLALAGVAIPWSSLAVAFVFFPAAYLFYGSLMLGTGALGANSRESNQFGMIWSILVVAPFPFLEALLNEPAGTAARVLTWIPFATPITVVVRKAVDPTSIAWWEIAGALLLLLASTWVAIRVGARLFRVGLLLTGARPKLREILRQARLD